MNSTTLWTMTISSMVAGCLGATDGQLQARAAADLGCAPNAIASHCICGEPRIADGCGNQADSETEGMSPEARVEYEQRYLTVIDELSVSHGNSSKKYKVYQGKYKREIEEGRFYRLVGKPDYADSLHSRQLAQGVLVVGGMATLLGGAIGGLAVALSNRQEECQLPRGPAAAGSMAFEACVERNVHQDAPDFLVPGLFVAAGGVMLFSSGFINPRPAAPDEMRRLADEYNAALRRRLSEAPAPAASRFRLYATPYAGPGGGGFGMRGTF